MNSKKYKDVLYSMRYINDLRDMVCSSAELYGERPAFLVKDNPGGKYIPITYIPVSYTHLITSKPKRASHQRLLNVDAMPLYYSLRFRSGGSALKNFVEMAMAMNPMKSQQHPRIFDRESRLIQSLSLIHI